MKTDAGRSRKVAPLATLFGVVVLGLILRYVVFAPDPIEVRVQGVERGLVESTVSNSKAGTVEARRRSRIAAEIGGRVVEIVHREGAHVKAGDALVLLSDVSHLANDELSQHGVAVSRSRLEDACLLRDRAGRELTRMQRLAENNVASEDRLDALQYGFDSARVACVAAKAELAQASAQRQSAAAELAKTVIVAPFDGIVAEVNVEIGEWVTPSPPLLTSPPVVDLIDPTSIFVSAPMDEVDSGAVRAGLPVKLTIDSRPGEVFAGTVSRVAPYVVDEEAQNRTLEIEVSIDDAGVAVSLLPGTSADAEVVLEDRQDVLRVPSSALLGDASVLLLRGGELVEVAVELGLRNWKFAEITNGLEEGDQVVIALDRIEIKSGIRAVAMNENGDSSK
ncbi:MAG: efflux RND transporter periplasmic adaptor subunit [Myxococcales bacterium]|nr:efflux RND transporter periplasmic adaptor subunit [Myxococcales bacterium]HIK84628.1 efflux RND transporter periplasmic adaptor subunit [Myxococcales bacterium]